MIQGRAGKESTEAGPKPAVDSDTRTERALVFHQGLPLAICRVTHMDERHLHLDGGPLGLEQGARVAVDFLTPPARSSPASAVVGRLASPDRDTLTIRREEAG